MYHPAHGNLYWKTQVFSERVEFVRMFFPQELFYSFTQIPASLSRKLEPSGIIFTYFFPLQVPYSTQEVVCVLPQATDTGLHGPVHGRYAEAIRRPMVYYQICVGPGYNLGKGWTIYQG